METRKALGRGLEQLFNAENLDLESFEKTVYDTATKEEIIDIDLDELRPNPYQPRKVFNDESLKDKMKTFFTGLKGYEIIAGERRVRASRLVGLKTIPAIIRNLNDEQMMEIALLENLQRENLSCIEEAIAYKKMIESLSLTQDELAKKVGKSRSHITNTIGLLRLPKEVQELINDGKISMGHARVLSKLEDDNKIIELAHKIVDEKLPVRDIEKESLEVEKKVKVERTHKSITSEYKYVEDLLRDKLDTKVKIKDKKIEISFTNNADLNRILEVLNVRE